MFSFKYFLLENPDTVIFPDGKELKYNSDGTISFYIFNGYYVYSFSKKDEVYGHMQLFDSLKVYYLETLYPERLESYFNKYPRSKEAWSKSKPYFHTYGKLTSKIADEIESSLNNVFHDFTNMALVGRIWQDNNIVSFWNYQTLINSFINDLFNFLSIFGNPRDYKYEFIDTPRLKFLEYDDLLKRDVIKKDSKIYEIEGTKYTLDELRTMRINVHVKNDKVAEKFLCRNLTDDFLKLHPELSSLKPTTCDKKEKDYIPSKLQRYLKQGYNYPLFSDWKIDR